VVDVSKIYIIGILLLWLEPLFATRKLNVFIKVGSLFIKINLHVACRTLCQ
jgi:hypothetical protein